MPFGGHLGRRPSRPSCGARRTGRLPRLVRAADEHLGDLDSARQFWSAAGRPSRAGSDAASSAPSDTSPGTWCVGHRAPRSRSPGPRHASSSGNQAANCTAVAGYSLPAAGLNGSHIVYRRLVYRRRKPLATPPLDGEVILPISRCHSRAVALTSRRASPLAAAASAPATLADIAATSRTHLGSAVQAQRRVGRRAKLLLQQLGRAVHLEVSRLG